MYFDTHAHLDDAAFDEDRDELLARLMECGVDCVLDPGCDPESSRKAAALAEREDWIWFAAGIHPEELHAFTAEGLEEIAALLRHPKCRAVGEIGLDYYWDDTHKEEQKQLFHAQLSMALERDLPGHCPPVSRPARRVPLLFRQPGDGGGASAHGLVSGL